MDEQQIEQLKQIVPEAFADGKINWETLKESLGNFTEEENADTEHFGLFWPGKRKARKLSGTISPGTLVPVPGEGVNEEVTKNIFIEGENLDVLKLLQKSYPGKIKMIYIDPPYNTGKDFVYDDNFTETIKEYLKRTGQIDEEGKKLTTNPKADGRFHSKWLSMMYPRLRLARNLLREDGIIFISIDDNEVFHLRSIMNEIFGLENFIGVLKRRAARKTAHLSSTMSDMCDYVVIYCKSEMNEPLSVEGVKDNTRPVFNQGNKITERIIRKDSEARCKDGRYKKGEYKVKSLSFALMEDLVIENGRTKNEIVIKAPWRMNQTVLDKTLYVSKNFGFRRYLLPEEYEKAKAMNDLIDIPELYNEVGSEELERLFGVSNIFDNPKPHTLINYLIKAAEGKDKDDDFIILDFFAGSGSTGQAIYELDEDAGNKKFILVQLNEKIDENKVAYKKGYRYIPEITRDRLMKSAKKNKQKNKELGFKYYRLRSSNYKVWENIVEGDIEKLELAFEKFESPLIDNWKEEDLLAEVMLIEGFPLDSKIEREEAYTKNKVQAVTSDFHEHRLLVCLDKKVSADTIKALQLKEDDVFICLDNAITDEQKVTLSDKGLIKTI